MEKSGVLAPSVPTLSAKAQNKTAMGPYPRGPFRRSNQMPETEEKVMTSSRGTESAGPPGTADGHPAPSRPPTLEPDDGDDGPGTTSGFPQFALLPAELRDRIWYYFCAATGAQPRVLDFQFRPAGIEAACPWNVLPGSCLSARVRSANTALSVSRECRHFALKEFPDTLAIRGKKISGLVRFNKARDVVAVRIFQIFSHLAANCCPLDAEEFGPFLVRYADRVIPGFSDSVERLAVDEVVFDDEGVIHSIDGDDSRHSMLLWNLIGTFRNLKTLYRLLDHRAYALGDIHWCGSAAAVNSYTTVGPARVAYGRTREASVTIVWPDLEGNSEFARTRVHPPMMPLTRMVEVYDEENGVEEDFWDMFAGVELWPMVRFDGKSSQRILEQLKNTAESGQLPYGEAPGSDEPSCVATVDCDDPEGCLGHSVDGDLLEARECVQPESRRDWKTLHRAFDNLSDTSSFKHDPFDRDDCAWPPDRLHPDRFSKYYFNSCFVRSSLSSALETHTDGSQILGDFSPTETVEQWLEGVCEAGGFLEDEGRHRIAADRAECRLEREAA
ncbi:hypothetical protein MAPG_09478 [Magnaporthiopsis poae ATCC 64411]|uniref:2EXR domain-containing protein n=1 Tax=Magnaporthiopsis poae (strain ATCC 64411 / 73-15) TaxID=644358 RepID=A0A0C4EA23_MAGP6|nr:hypothetical protein MAPG_09478 [Magnaporthiopsis poae ATCC 64411]